jgi:glycosyltransferase involved in cell wall biosynthesis
VSREALAIVVQRYGPDVTGGSESLARAIAERLAGEYDVTVFTSRARDYVTWKNELPEGPETLGGVTVRRFGSVRERELQSFNALSDALFDKPHTQQQELEWLARQGPEVPALVEALKSEQQRFAAILFFTYLYYPTYWGLQAASSRSILVPTTHDEPALRLAIFREVFALPKALAFLTPPEEQLVRARFAVGDRPAFVAGSGVDGGPPPDVEAFKIRHDVRGPFALYAGRIDAGKGCAEMLAFYDRYRRSRRGACELLLIGKLAMPEPRSPGVRYLGFVSEQEKRQALAGAAAVICPSPYESLSISLLEALSLETPVLANARSPVLLDHCRRSNAGLYYATADEFVESLDLLVGERELGRRLGGNGARYVAAEYSWPVVMERYKKLIRAVGTGAR